MKKISDIEISDISYAAGLMWYVDAHSFIQTMANRYGKTLKQAAGVLAALSPQMEWELNKQQTESMLAGENVVWATYPQQVKKAEKILANPDVDPMDILGPRAYKTKAFYQNLLEPDNFDGPVTIDRHMMYLLDMDPEQPLRKWHYDMLSIAITYCAHEQNLRPCQLQAMLWVQIKKIKGEK